MALPLRRELDLVFGARATWAALVLAALVTGHSLVLAVDLFAASSRSVAASALMDAQMDPLAGIVRPTLGGMHLAASLFVPLLAARGLAIEKERRSWVALAVAQGGTTPALVAKIVAAFAASLALLAAPIACLAVYVVVGGALDPIETAVALTGHAIHLAALALVCVLAASVSTSVAQAAALGIALALGSWIVEVATGFAALAWLAPLEALAIDRPLASFETGIVRVSSVAYFVVLGAGALAACVVMASFARDRSRSTRAAAILLVTLSMLALTPSIRGAWDWSEQRRGSLPPAVADAMRALPGPIAIDVWLDRDDARRALVDRGALSRLRLARPDIDVRYPLDAAEGTPARDRAYGMLVVRVADAERETRSTAPRELSTLVFELSDRAMPAYVQPPYLGHPAVIAGAPRTLLATFAYALLPGAMLSLGWRRTRRRSR